MGNKQDLRMFRRDAYGGMKGSAEIYRKCGRRPRRGREGKATYFRGKDELKYEKTLEWEK